MTNAVQFPKKWIILRGLIRGRFHWKGFDEKFKSALGIEELATPELLGNGFLAAEKTPDTIDAAIENLQSQINFKSTGPIGLLGISLGGMLATRWAQIHPEMFSHLVIINSSSTLSPFYRRLKPANYLGILKLLSQANPTGIETFILQATTNAQEKWPQHLPENIEFHKKHPIQIGNFIQQLKIAGQVNFKEVPKPKKLILTSKADSLVDCRCSERIAQEWGAPIAYHETAGHDLSFDDGDWIIESVKKQFKF